MNSPGIVVVSGGTAANSLLSTFAAISNRISYILPISDNGGSTSEIIRVIGGPAIGDIRSRIVRLIPPESNAIRDLFSYRLPEIAEKASSEWKEIVEGTHELWAPIESQCKDFLRPFFLSIHVELLKRSRPHREFHFESASIGNLFLTGARLFCGSLDAAVELMTRLTLVPPSVSVLAALNTNFSHNISAQLVNGLIITGQSQISHPSNISSVPTYSNPTFSAPLDDSEDAHLPFSHPDLLASQLHFSKNKDATPPLISPIKRVFYINPYGQEIHPRASSRVLKTLDTSRALIFSFGSLFTSTIPIIILQGFAHKLKTIPVKIVLMNGSLDRETEGMNGLSYIRSLVGACLYSDQVTTTPYANTTYNSSVSLSPLANALSSTPTVSSRFDPYNQKTIDTQPLWSQFVTHVVYLKTSPLTFSEAHVQFLEKKGVKCVPIEKSAADDQLRYDLSDLELTIQNIIDSYSLHF